MKFRLIFITVFAFFLTSCATYKETWIPPTGASGSMCVMQCNNSKEYCQVSKQSLAQRCESEYSWAMADYQSCKLRNPQTSYCTSYRSKTETINGQTITRQECTSTRYDSPCKEPVKSCSKFGNDSQCEANYRACFVSCGGVIDRREVK